MDFEYNDEQRMLADSVARWLEASYGFEDFRRFAADHRQAQANWPQMAELGLLGLNIPEADGGLGGGAVETLLVMQAFGRALVVDPFVGTAVAAVALLNSEPGWTGRRELLSKIAAGSRRIALAALEPEGRFDLTHVATSAASRGDRFVLSGRKAVV